MTRSGKTIEQMQETRKHHRCRSRSSGLAAGASVTEPRRSVFRSVGPQLTSSNLNLSRAGLQRRYPLFGALALLSVLGSRHGEKKFKKSEKIATRLRRDTIMVCSDQCELCCGACY